MKPLEHPLVTDGRFHIGRYAQPFARLNFLDADPGSRLGYRLRGLRLKEWQAFQFTDGRFFGIVALFDAKFLALVQAKVYDSQTGQKHMFEKKVLTSAFTVPDQILDSGMAWQGREGSMTFRTCMREDRASVRFDLPAAGSGLRLRASFDVDYRGVEPVVVCLPFDDKRAMYSQKGVAPITGELAVGDEVAPLTPDRAFALLDDHRGYYPRVMTWDWLTTGGFLEDGTLWGLNLTRNQCLNPEEHNENVLWVGGRGHALGPVTFSRTGFEKSDVWTVRDSAGEVDVRFEVEAPGQVDLNLGLFESRYRGPFGRVTGRVALAGAEPVSIDGALAMGERFWLKV